jgi:hypothetical protein
LPAGVAEELRQKIDDIAARADQISTPQSVSLLQDPGFESSLGTAADATWSSSHGPTSNAQIDAEVHFEGQQSLKLESRGDSVVVRSQPFPVPRTGRLFLSLRLRTSDPPRPTPLVLGLETDDGSYRRLHRWDGTLSTQWDPPFMLRVDDLPADPQQQLRVRLQLLGAGEVWIDDVQLFDTWFEREEQSTLRHTLQVALTQLGLGDVAGCYRTLSGYWPRFLLRHIPRQSETVAAVPRRRSTTAPRPQRTSMLDRIRRYVPQALRN